MKNARWLAATWFILALGAAPGDARAAGFGGKFEALISSAPAKVKPALQALRLLVSKSFRALAADARLHKLRRGLYGQFQPAFRPVLVSARIHALAAGAGLAKSLRAGLHRAWHLTGRYAKRKLRLAKIPAVFATVRRKSDEGLAIVEGVRLGRDRYRPDLFNALFPRVAPKAAARTTRK